MKALIIRFLWLIIIYEKMCARALSFWLALSHSFYRCFLQNLIIIYCDSKKFSDSEFFMTFQFMFALEGFDVLRSKWLLSLFAFIKIFSNHLNKTNAQFSSGVVTSWDTTSVEYSVICVIRCRPFPHYIKQVAYVYIEK